MFVIKSYQNCVYSIDIKLLLRIPLSINLMCFPMESLKVIHTDFYLIWAQLWLPPANYALILRRFDSLWAKQTELSLTLHAKNYMQIFVVSFFFCLKAIKRINSFHFINVRKTNLNLANTNIAGTPLKRFGSAIQFIEMLMKWRS